MARDRGDYSRATALLGESLGLFGELGDKEGAVLDLEELAAVACALEQPDPAARLFGTAHAMREAIGAPVPPSNQEAYERVVRVASARLGDDPFAVAWAWGREATPE